MRRTTGEDEGVEWKLADIRRHGVPVEVDRFHLSQQRANIRISGKHGADGCGNLSGTKPGHRYLIEERLKQVVIPLVDQRDFNVVDSTQSFRRVDTDESASHDEDPFHA